MVHTLNSCTLYARKPQRAWYTHSTRVHCTVHSIHAHSHLQSGAPCSRLPGKRPHGRGHVRGCHLLPPVSASSIALAKLFSATCTSSPISSSTCCAAAATSGADTSSTVSTVSTVTTDVATIVRIAPSSTIRARARMSGSWHFFIESTCDASSSLIRSKTSYSEVVTV